MYKWLKAYLNEFGTNFPFSEVADKTEYEICRIIQYCVIHHIEYSEYVAEEDDGGEGGSEPDEGGGGSDGGEEEETAAIVGTAVVGKATVGTEQEEE